MRHVYWAVKCNTLDCPAEILLRYAGVHDTDHIPVLPKEVAESFSIPCGNCERSHEYRRRELITVQTDQEPGPSWRDKI